MMVLIPLILMHLSLGIVNILIEITIYCLKIKYVTRQIILMTTTHALMFPYLQRGIVTILHFLIAMIHL